MCKYEHKNAINLISNLILNYTVQHFGFLQITNQKFCVLENQTFDLGEGQTYLNLILLPLITISMKMRWRHLTLAIQLSLYVYIKLSYIDFYCVSLSKNPENYDPNHIHSVYSILLYHRIFSAS